MNNHNPSDKTPAVHNCEYHLTFDVDWAPDCAMELLLGKLNTHNIKATFFITHPSDILKDVSAGGHNIGIHPNFLANSTQGKNTSEVIEYLLKLAPEASCIRTHALVQSTPLLFEIFENYPQLKYDFSIFMYKFKHVNWFEWKFKTLSYMRINYNWEDDGAFYDPSMNWAQFTPFADKIIFDFHPIHVLLNSKDLTPYESLKSKFQNTPLANLKEKDILKFKNPLNGSENYLDAILESKYKAITFSELTP